MSNSTNNNLITLTNKAVDDYMLKFDDNGIHVNYLNVELISYLIALKKILIEKNILTEEEFENIYKTSNQELIDKMDSVKVLNNLYNS